MSKVPPPSGPNLPGGGGASVNNGGGVGENGQPNVQRIEAIKQYYNQLCTNLRHIVDQLNAPEVTPQRRQTLLHQQDQVQKSLQEFTEKVLKPLAAVANTQAPRPGGTALPAAPQPPTVAQPSRVIVPPGAGAGPKIVSPPPVPVPPPAPPPPMPTAPLPFQNAPLAARQTLQALQKQSQLIQQQQVIFGQKILSKNFDSSLNHAHREAMKPRYEDGMANCESISLLAPQRLARTPAIGSSSLHSRETTGQTAKQLLAKIAPRLNCTEELEEAILRLSDEFIESVGSLGAQLAVSRKATRLSKKDLEIAAERMYGIVIPGSHRSTVLGSSVRKLTKRPAGASSNPHQVRMAQLKKFFAQNPHLQ